MKSKYETNVLPKLKLIEAWCRDGITEKEISKRLQISYSSFRGYKEKYPALLTVLARTREIVDNVEMINAYKRRAEGYTVTEYRREYTVTADGERILTKEVAVDKHVPGDARAMENWIRLRMKSDAIWGQFARLGDEVVEAGQQNNIVLIPARSEVVAVPDE